MARDGGNEKQPLKTPPEEEIPDGGGLFPDMARRAIAFGLSGLFLTEETIRKALGDTLPRDWQDFAIHQSERTRKEFMERLSFEIAQSLESIDVVAVLEQLLAGRTVEVKATFRLGERSPKTSDHELQVYLKDDGDAE
ncbi:MAG: hypothetical protein ACR2P8_05055 [Myxococcota bacterium]